MAVPIDLLGGNVEMEEAEGIAVSGERSREDTQQGLFEVGQVDDAAVDGEFEPVGAAAMTAIGATECEF
jgi:hypothetical protein